MGVLWKGKCVCFSVAENVVSASVLTHGVNHHTASACVYFHMKETDFWISIFQLAVPVISGDLCVREIEKFWNFNDVADSVARSGLRRTVTHRTNDKLIWDLVFFWIVGNIWLIIGKIFLHLGLRRSTVKLDGKIWKIWSWRAKSEINCWKIWKQESSEEFRGRCFARIVDFYREHIGQHWTSWNSRRNQAKGCRGEYLNFFFNLYFWVEYSVWKHHTQILTSSPTTAFCDPHEMDPKLNTVEPRSKWWIFGSKTAVRL